MFLHIMVGQKIKKLNANILCDVRIYLRKKMYITIY
jgi:hypothetical protein